MESRIRTTGHAATVAVGVKNVQRIFRQCVLFHSVLLEDLIIVAMQKMYVLTITKAYEHAVSLASFECSSRPLDFYSSVNLQMANRNMLNFNLFFSIHCDPKWLKRSGNI